MQLRPWRITSWWGKLSYALIAMFGVGSGLTWLLGVLGLTAIASLVVSGLFDIVVLLVGARIFRGRGEPVAPPRPWWQMTARQKLSSNLGSWLAVVTGVMAVCFVLSLFDPARTYLAESALLVLYFAIPTYLYLNSAARLQHWSANPRPVASSPSA
jgi:uncharacterized membrane protein YfcA